MNSVDKTALLLERSLPEPMGAEQELGQKPTEPTRLGRLAFIAAILVALGAIVGYLPRAHQRTTLIAETRELAIPTVSIASPKLARPDASLALPGEIRAFIDAPIYSRANGYLKKWMVDLGADVKEGDLLAEIDVPELDQELAQAKAQVAQAEAALGLAKTTAARWTELYKNSVVSEQESNEKQADFALKQANLEAARANVHRLQDLQSFTKVLAPFSGTITARRTDIGELIRTESGKELFHLAQTHTLRVYVHVPQTIARGITVGQTAEVTIPELPAEKFAAKVVRTSGAMTTASRTLLTELELANQDGKILAGTFAQVRFPNLETSGTLTVPSNAVLFRAEGTQLAFITDDQVHLHNVTLGRDFGSTVEVLAGASQNDSVVLNPPDSIVSGMKVRVAK
jgi:membrane fusion protein (multidrug efflux system)